MMSSLQIATWNVNSVRAREGHVLDWLEAHKPDLLALQETKVADDQFPRNAFEAAGYTPYIWGQKAYNGVAFLAREPLENLRCGLEDDAFDMHKRLLAATVGDICVLNLYAPNGQDPKAEAFDFKRRWYQSLIDYLNRHHTPDEPLLLVGDFNIAPGDLDVWDPVKLKGAIGFHPDEHLWLKNLMDWGFVDLFRARHADTKAFSWWDYRFGYPRNQGMRIDLMLATPALAARCTDITIDATTRGWDKPSDHVPVAATFSR